MIHPFSHEPILQSLAQKEVWNGGSTCRGVPHCYFVPAMEGSHPLPREDVRSSVLGPCIGWAKSEGQWQLSAHFTMLLSKIRKEG